MGACSRRLLGLSSQLATASLESAVRSLIAVVQVTGSTRRLDENVSAC